MYLLMHSDSLHTINDTMMMMLHTNSWNTDGACNLRTHSSSAGSRCCTLSLIRVSTARSIIPLAKALCERSERIFGSLFFFFFFTPFNWHRHRFDIRCIVRMGHCVQVLLAGHLPNFLECIWRAALDRPQSSVGCCACIHRQSKQTYWLPHATATVDSNFILQAFQPAANRNGTWIVEWTDDDSRVEGGEYPSWLPLQMHSNSYCLSRSWTIHYQTDTHTLDTYTQSTCNMFNTRSFAFLACRLLCADRRKLDIFGEFFCRTTNITLTAGWWLITLLAMCCAGLSMQQSVWLEHKLPTMQHDNDI